MHPTLWGILTLAATLGCGGTAQKTVLAPPPGPQGPAAAGVRVSLLWTEPVDLDLYVTDPTFESVYFANPVAQSDGRLEADIACSGIRGREASGPSTETVGWATPGAGRYRVGVDFIDACGAEIGEAGFRVVAEVLGERRETTGTVRKDIFQPIVLEFDVPGK